MFKAYFNDGKTSARRECEVKLLPGSLGIQFNNGEESAQVSNWNIDAINKLDVRTSSTVLKYGEFPQEVLEFEDQRALDEIISRYPYASFHQSNYNKFVSLGKKGILFSMLGVLIFGALFFVYGAPALSDAFARAIPEEYETYIGENVQQTYLQYLEVDSVRSQTMQQFYDELQYTSNYDIQVVVVESDMVNAFALPGGFIVVFSGILDIIDDEQELAGLLAHEASHINGRHSLRMMARSLSFYLLLSIVSGDFGGFSSVIIENSSMVGNLSFSRGIEKEADLEGVKLMNTSKLDPQGMIDLFEKFGNLRDSKDQEVTNRSDMDTSLTQDSTSTWRKFSWNKVEQLLSTHPFPENRIEYLDAAIGKDSNEPKINIRLKELFDEIKGEEY